MRKVLKIAGIVFGVVIAVFAAAFIVLKAITDEQYKAWATSAVRSSTGRDFSIGDLEIDLGTSFRMKAKEVHLGNADWGSRPDMLSIAELEAELGLVSLLAGVADVRTVIGGAFVGLETNADGKGNWSMGAGDSGVEPGAGDLDAGDDGFGLPFRPLIRELRIDDFVVSVTDGAGERTGRIERLLVETRALDTTLSVAAAIGPLPIELKGNLGPLSEVLDQHSSPMELGGKVGDTVLKVSGDWGPLLPEANMDLEVKWQIPSTAQMMTMIGVELQELGVAELDLTLSARQGHFTIGRLLTDLDGQVVAASVEGSIADLAALEGIDITAKGGTSALNRLITDLNLEVPVQLPPSVQVEARFTGSLDGLVVDAFTAKMAGDGLEIEASGSVGNALSSDGIDATVTAKASSTAALSKYADLAVPHLGALDVSAKVSSGGQVISISALKATVSSDNLNLDLTGSVADAIAVSGVDATFGAEIGTLTPQNLSEISHLLQELDIDLPLDLLPKSAKLGARASGGLDEGLAVDGLNGEVRDDGLVLTVAGTIEDALALEGMTASFTLTSDSLSALSKYAQTELPAVGALEISGALSSRGRSFSLESLDASLHGAGELDVSINASMADILALSGVDIELDAAVASLASLSELAKTELPATDPVTVNASLRGDEANGGAVTANVKVATGSARATLDGVVSNLKSLDDLDVDILVEADSLSDFDKVAQASLPAKGPLRLSGTARVRPGEYALEDFRLNLAEQSASGFLGVRPAATDDEKTAVKGELDIPFLDLSPLLAGPPQEPAADQSPAGSAPAGKSGTKDAAEDREQGPAPPSAPAAGRDRVFSEDPLPLEALRKIDAEFSVTAQRLKLGEVDMTDFETVLSLKNGLLSIDPVRGVAGDGTMGGKMFLDARRDLAKVDVDIVMTDIPMPRFGGGFDLEIDLDGEGSSSAAVMAGLDGRFILVVRDGVIANSYLTSFGSGLFSFSGSKNTTALECGILRMDIDDGKVDFDDKLAVQLADVTWRGGGEINLKTEKLDVGIVPRPRKGIGIGAGGLASLVHVGGTLKKPKIRLDPKDVAVKYGKYMAYLSTGGLSLLAEAVINKSRANVDVCKKILDGTVFEAPAAGSAETQTQGSTPSSEVAPGPSGDGEELPREDLPQTDATRPETSAETAAQNPAAGQIKSKGKPATSKNLQ